MRRFCRAGAVFMLAPPSGYGDGSVSPLVRAPILQCPDGMNWLLLLCLAVTPLAAAAAAPSPVTGVVWQLHPKAPDASGSWHRLGARELLVQWTVADGVAYVSGTGLPEAPRMPDWKRIAREPWAERVIVGLSGRADEQTARRSLDAMAAESMRVARLR